MAVQRISKEELKQRLDGSAEQRPVIVDVRLKYPYEHSTITLPGAQRMNPDGNETRALPRDRDIVLYDSEPGEFVAERFGDELRRQGHRVFVLQGGLADWVTAKLPTDPKPSPQNATATAATPKG